MVEIVTNNQSGTTYYQWCMIDKDTYLLVNGKSYTLAEVVGIEIAPQKTYFSYAGQDLTFKLYFPPIPKSANSVDLIEPGDSSWKFYGINVRR